MRNERYRFALLVHSEEIIDECKKAVGNSGDEIFYDVIDFNSGPKMAMSCLDNGYEVILCHGGTGDTIFRSVPRSVVKIERTDMDVLRTLLLARQYANRIVLSSYQDEFHTSIPDEMERLLNIKVRNAVYDSPETMRSAIKECVFNGFSVLIGGGVSKKCMESYGGRGFIIKPTQRSICLAFERARHLASAQRQAQMRDGNMKMILEELQEGVLCIDSSLRVIIANKAAYKLLDAPNGAARDYFKQFFQPLGLLDTIRDLSPQENRFVKLAGEGFISTTYPLSLYSETPCAVCIFRDAPSLQKINRTINKGLYSRGLVAHTTIEDIKGASDVINNMKSIIRKYAMSDANIFIQGETGTGKELVAHAIHAASKRHARPFVAVNISALSPSLVESELFGYEEGAFTGAKKGGKAGFFEMAHMGTLFLDEIGDVSEDTQLRLLRVLENREIIRVGGSRLHSVDVRVICATNRPLLNLVRNGKFRMDLYYRLTTFKISVPPLRSRLQDIPFILQNLLKKFHKSQNDLPPELLHCLGAYAWPGNIRELLSIFENYLLLLGNNPPDAALLSHIIKEQSIDNVASFSADDIQKTQNYLSPEKACGPCAAKNLKDRLNQDRLAIVLEAVRSCGGNKKKAAKNLGIGYSSLCRILNMRNEKAESYQNW